MDIALTGSSGLIGTALRFALDLDGHRILRVMRSGHAAPDSIGWDPSAGSIDAGGLEGLDAVIHLAGAGVGDRRWNEDYKQTIRDSRVEGTNLLARTLADLDRPPKTLVSSSAIGYYGSRGDEKLDESSTPGSDFLAEMVVEWEAATTDAEQAGIRVAHARTGVVLSAKGGALGKVLPLFKAGLGGKLGSGLQYWSWISIDDVVDGFRFLVANDVSGSVNLTGPEPVTNAVYTTAVGQALGRPTVLSVPAFAPRLLLGREMADSILFASARVFPRRLEQAGFSFRHRTVAEAVEAVLTAGSEHA